MLDRFRQWHYATSTLIKTLRAACAKNDLTIMLINNLVDYVLLKLKNASFLSDMRKFVDRRRRRLILQVCLQHVSLYTEYQDQGSTLFLLLRNTTGLDSRLQVSSYTCPKLKEVDDVLGGSAAWENVDETNGRTYSHIVFALRMLNDPHSLFTLPTETCPKCRNLKAYFMQMQTRSADEPMTIFFKCTNCGHRWKE